MTKSISTASETSLRLYHAIDNADFSKLIGEDKQQAGLAIKLAACNTLVEVIQELSTEYRQDTSNASQVRKFANEALERMKGASPNARIDCLGIDIVRETADRVSSCERLPIPISVASGLLNYGIDPESVYISKDGTTAAASALDLAEASDEDIYSIVADTWLYLRGHEWAKPLKAA